jgi:SAM-dependent methyltransferase
VSRLKYQIQKLNRRLRSGSDEKITATQPGLCKFLKSRDEIDECTRFLRRNGFISHSLTCKDWDLAHILPDVGDGDVLDMGSSDSYLLKNLSLGRRNGTLFGIDLREPDVKIPRARYIVGDLMQTGLPDGAFRYVSCLSVIEHQVDFDRMAAEASRLLEEGGRFYVTFDYWEPRVNPEITLYGLEWQPLDAASAKAFCDACEARQLRLVEPMDWSLGDAVIREGYYSPQPEINYTFGLAVFEKRSSSR